MDYMAVLSLHCPSLGVGMEVAEFSTIGPAFNMRLDKSPPILFVSRRTCVNDDARPGFFATGQEKSRPLFMQYSILGEKVSIALG